MRTPSARHKRRSIRSGYAFAHQEGFGRLITSGKMSVYRNSHHCGSRDSAETADESDKDNSPLPVKDEENDDAEEKRD